MDTLWPVGFTLGIVAACLWIASFFGPYGPIRRARKPEGASDWVASRLRAGRSVDVPSRPMLAWAALFAAAAVAVLAVHLGRPWTTGSTILVVGALGFVVLAVVLGGPWPTARIRMEARGVRVGRRFVSWKQVRGVRVARFRTGTNRDEDTRSSPIMRTRAELTTDDGVVQLPYGAFVALDGPAVAGVVGAAREQLTGERMSVCTTPRNRSTIGGEVRRGGRAGDLNTFAVLAAAIAVLEFVVAAIWGPLIEGDGPGAYIPFAVVVGLLGAAALVCGIVGRVQISRFAEQGRRAAKLGMIVGGLTVFAVIGLLITR